jgi:CheY-like chemotaxis protein
MATGTSAALSQRPRAFIVDDSHIARYILSCELERLGYEPEVAESAEAAFRQLGQPWPDVIFMDHLLPGIDGLEAVSRLRGQAETSELPIIMYTSQDSDEFAERARSVGADDIYVKTADESKLAGILEQLNLLPNRPVAAKSGSNVTPIRRQSPARRQKSTVTREQLARLLEPSLEAHHSKLRQELLGEFAILERFEERMRRDLFARVETLSRQTDQRLDRARRAARAARRRRGKRLTFAAASFAACMILIAALGVRLAWDTAARTDALQAVTVSTLEAVQESSGTLVELQETLDAQSALAAAASTVSEARGALGPDVFTPNAATLLIDELQSLGILGPIRIETNGGAFCVSASATGPLLVNTYGPLQSCEQLPMQLTTWNRRP